MANIRCDERERSYVRREAREAARARDRQAAAASQNEAEESDESDDEAAGERTTRVGRADDLGCTRFSSRTPSVFLSFFLYNTLSFLSISPGKLRGNRQIFGSEPSLTEAGLGPQISQILGQIGKMPGISEPVYTWKLPCDRLGILSISSILPGEPGRDLFTLSGRSRRARRTPRVELMRISSLHYSP